MCMDTKSFITLSALALLSLTASAQLFVQYATTEQQPWQQQKKKVALQGRAHQEPVLEHDADSPLVQHLRGEIVAQ